MKIPAVSKCGKKFKRTATKAETLAFARQKAIVSMRDKQGLKFIDIAKILKVSPTRVSRLYVLGKRKYLK